ncbi:MAG TPA: hypothetical protein VF209_05590 [Patescibacteria group bacterium]
MAAEIVDRVLTSFDQIEELNKSDVPTGIYLLILNSDLLRKQGIDEETISTIEGAQSILVYAIMVSQPGVPLNKDHIRTQYQEIATMIANSEGRHPQLITTLGKDISFGKIDNAESAQLYKEIFGDAINWLIKPPFNIALLAFIKATLNILQLRHGLTTAFADTFEEAISASALQAETLSNGERPEKNKILGQVRSK